ncbi:hypothetical protein PR202_ga02119 [Eleusine coracana subsp. coracana]|uniref:E3 ubiquitin-protein ligase RMA n=1 Tax=Eleusine coracana subsp. coracana TaxID=191504 RepID=A0AAV5BKS4_ELECO|nr:hypothetical protein PR202_ga01432 [Eleusine coracana subsp. coracana]GJM86275.1 hypothetical protein PR202_ga02119 [Eleusine coracana subsp. coracana]
MDHTRTSGGTDGVNELPAAAGNEPAKRTIRGDASAAEAGGGGGCFDCNICLDAAADPVVTLCGHLYCWPCIYEWLRPQTDADAESRSSARRQSCPVCKAAVTPDALVPLYGRGSSVRAMKPPHGVLSIPRRPAVRQSDQDRPGPPPRGRHHAGAAEFDLAFPLPFRDRGMTHSTMAGGMLGGLAMAALPWVLRGQEQPPSMYFPSPYHLTPSQRRQHVELERSLHQIWFFLSVLVLLCFLLF